jgi:cytochrome c-type biogenesis protein CcmH
MRRALATLAVLAVLALPATAVAQQPEPRTTLPDIEDEVMCTICGVTLELATDAPQAIREREYIRTLIARGLSKDEIKDRLVAQYGPQVLAIPGDEGFDLAAWLVPGAAIVIAGGAIFVGLRRWRREGRRRAAAKPEASEEVDSEEQKRLDEDLARYDV